MNRDYKQDCFAFRVGRYPYCRALNSIDCGACCFYKTKKQHEKEIEMIEVRRIERQESRKAEEKAED